MIYLYGLILVFVVLLAVILVKAARFRPVSREQISPVPVRIDQEHAVQSLSEMVQIPTVSGLDPDQVDWEAFASFRKYLLGRYPLVSETCEVHQIGKTGVLYHLPGESGEKPVVLMAHYDVVPVTDTWEHPPFCGKVIDGRLWGRGTLDTKGTLCSLMEAAEHLLTNGYRPKNDLYFAFSGDEEILGDTAPAMVSWLEENGVKPAMVLDEGGAVVTGVFPGVSSPCAVIGIAEKGRLDIRLTAESKGGHASAPPAHTPVGVLAKAVCRLEEHPFPMHLSPGARGLFLTLGRESSSFPIRMVFANLWLFLPLVKCLFSSLGGEMNALMRTTCAATMAWGSKQVNVLPAKATVGLNLRLNTGDSSDYALSYIRRTIRNDQVRVEADYAADPSPSSRMDSPEYALLADTIRESWPDAVPSPYPMLACSDSRHYARICDCVYRFSAMVLSKEERGLMHADNERIKPDTLGKCVEFYIRLMQKL